MLQSMRSAAKYIWILLIIAFVGGFLLFESSGLMGRAPVTNGTAVATVDGEDISYAQWQNAIQSLLQSEEARLGRMPSADEQQRIENQAWEQLVNEVLLRHEYDDRGIRVTDAEIRQAALNSPPPQLMQASELQTDGRFDIDKYRRFLASPVAAEQGIRLALEQYYRAEIPRRKLYGRIAGDVYPPDAQLWRMWQDQNDSAQVSYVALPTDTIADSAVTVTDAEIRDFYDRHRPDFVRAGRAVVSLITLPRLITAADSQATRERASALRQEIESGTSTFEDVARRESSDSVSAANGGLLGRGTLEGMGFITEFNEGVRATPTGEISQPVLSSFGYHLIKVDERTADTVQVRHILVPLAQSDSSAARTDRRADSIATILGASDGSARFDSVARAMGLPVTQHTVAEGDALFADNGYVPDVTAWVFRGATPGQTSELVTDDRAYYIARLDSVTHSGQQELDAVRDEIRRELGREKKAQALMPVAQRLAQAAAQSTLEAAAAQQGRTVQQSPLFTRLGGTPGLGTATRAVGAAFGLPVGAVGTPVSAGDAVVVLRVDRRVRADSAAWAAQRGIQRLQVTQQLRQQRVEQFLANLRRSAKVVDRRSEVRAAGQAQADG